VLRPRQLVCANSHFAKRWHSAYSVPQRTAALHTIVVCEVLNQKFQCIHVYTYMHTHTYIYIYMCVYYVYICVNIYTYIYIHIYLYIYISIYIYVYIRTYICIYVYVYVYTYINTYIETPKLVFSVGFLSQHPGPIVCENFVCVGECVFL